MAHCVGLDTIKPFAAECCFTVGIGPKAPLQPGVGSISPAALAQIQAALIAGDQRLTAAEATIKAQQAEIAALKAMPLPTNGRDGKDGVDGVNGQPGKDGNHGKDGTDGQAGKDGSIPAGTLTAIATDAKNAATTAASIAANTPGPWQLPAALILGALGTAGTGAKLLQWFRKPAASLPTVQPPPATRLASVASSATS